MYLDRFRFPEADHSGLASRSLLRDLAHAPRGIAYLISRGRPVLHAYRALNDPQSRQIFRDLLVYRYASPRFSRLANDRARFEQLESRMSANVASAPLAHQVTNSLGEPLRVWSVRYKDVDLEVTTSKYGLYWMLDSDQYYLKRNGIFIGPQTGDVVLDCGSHVGDVTLRFAVDVGPEGQVFGFDPDSNHVSISRENAARNRLASRMRFLACGVSDRFVQNTAEQVDAARVNAGRRLTSSDATISIDAFCREEKINVVNYIKMDIEGSEMKALIGASCIIERCRPKLAVCLYHKPDDLWEITNYIARQYPFYGLFLGHHSMHGEETVLYAAPRSQ